MNNVIEKAEIKATSGLVLKSGKNDNTFLFGCLFYYPQLKSP